MIQMPCLTCGRQSSHEYCREHDPDPGRAARRHRARYKRRPDRVRSPYHQLYRELGYHFRRLYTGKAAA